MREVEQEWNCNEQLEHLIGVIEVLSACSAALCNLDGQTFTKSESQAWAFSCGSHLSVCSRSHQLAFIWVIEDGLEEGVGKQAGSPLEGVQVPNDARAV